MSKMSGFARLFVVAIGATGLLSASAGVSHMGIGGPAYAQAQDPEDISPKRDAIRISFAVIGISGVGFFVPIQKGAAQAARDMGVQLDYKNTQTADFEEQARLIDAAVASKPDGLVVSMGNPDALSDAVKGAVDANIPTIVITDGRDAAHQLGTMLFIGHDSFQTGIESGKLMKANGATNVVCLNQAPGNASVEARCSGFKESFGGKVESIPMDEADPTSMRNGIKAHLQSHPEVDGLFALGSTSAEAAIDAVDELGLAGKIKIAGVDLSEKVLESIRDEKQLFAADQQQYLQGYLALQTLVLNRQYGVHPALDVLTGPLFVTKDNAAQAIELSAKGYR